MNLRRILTLLASLVISAIFLFLALYRVDFAEFGKAFISADYRLVGVAGLCWLTGYGLRTARWQRLLAPSKRISVARLFPPLIIGFALNNLMPGRPGEFVRAYLIGAREGLSKTLGLATVVAERVADGIMVIVFLLCALAAMAALQLQLPAGVETVATLSAILFGVALLGLVFLLVRQDLAMTLLRHVTRFLPHTFGARIEKMLDSFVIGLHAFRSPRNVVSIGLLSIGVWLLDSLAYFSMLSAFGALSTLDWRAAAALTLTALINLGVMIPAAPGGLGPYEAAGVFALATYGVNETTAASVALASHAVQYLLITGLGVFFIWREGVSVAQARQAGQ